MISKYKIPQIRFKGFSGEWNENKIGEKLSVSTGKSNTQDKEDEGKYPFYVRSPIIEYSNNYLYDEEAVLTVGDGVGTGKVYHYVTGKYNLHQRVYRIFNFKEISGQYFYHYFSNNFNSRVMSMTAKTSVDSVRLEMITDMNILYPRLEEQTKIGNYFQQLDKLIEQKEKKHQKLKQFKKAMLTKMFPKNGADTPEIRFKGFSGKWEEKRFEDNIVSIQTGTNILGSTTNSGTPLIKMGNIQRGSFSFEKVEYIDENIDVEKENLAKYGDFLFNTRNTLELVGKGATWMNNSDIFAFNNNIARFTFRGINTIFFNYLYNTAIVRKQVQARAMGTTSVAAIYPKNLNSIIYYLPEEDEQQKIGNYFQKLDKQIDLLQKEIEKLKKIKKASLDKMFV